MRAPATSVHGGALAKLLKDGARGAVCRGCHPNPAGAHHQFSAAELEAKGGGARAESAAACIATCRTPRRSAGCCWRPATRVCKGCHKT